MYSKPFADESGLQQSSPYNFPGDFLESSERNMQATYLSTTHPSRAPLMIRKVDTSGLNALLTNIQYILDVDKYFLDEVPKRFRELCKR